MNFYEIKQAILNLTDKDFVQFEEWFYKLGNKRLAKGIQLNEVRQAVLSLSNKDFDHFEDWFEDLCDERWAEEVKNDPMAQEAIKIVRLKKALTRLSQAKVCTKILHTAGNGLPYIS